MSERPFRLLTVENWREPDPLMASFFTAQPDAQSASRMSGDDWAVLILSPILSASAPDELRRVYEAARGALLYGWCFYPLYALGTAQLTRTVETAVTLRSKGEGAPDRLDFNGRIKHLESIGSISSSLAQGLHLIRKLRNEMTHAKDQDILPPAVAVMMLKRITEAVNQLFLSPQGTNE